MEGDKGKHTDTSQALWSCHVQTLGWFLDFNKQKELQESISPISPLLPKADSQTLPVNDRLYPGAAVKQGLCHSSSCKRSFIISVCPQRQ